MDIFKDCKYVKFRPWIGREYENGGGILGQRVLVLGASHYCSDLGSGKCSCCSSEAGPLSRCQYFTEDVINEMLYRYDTAEPWMQTFLCFERAVMGKELSQAGREQFWQSVAFYNYIQIALSGPRSPIPEFSYAPAGKAFQEVLETLVPDKILIWGKTLYRMLPDLNGSHSFIELSAGKADIWTYPIAGKLIPAMAVTHPSTAEGKKWEYWHKFHSAFLK